MRTFSLLLGMRFVDAQVGRKWFAGWLLLGALFLPMISSAQGRTANWIFGDGYHVKYTEGEPEVLPFVEDYAAWEGASCISDATGQLLFYSNSVSIWNRDFEYLWNSDIIVPTDVYSTSSVTNGSIFLPFPGDSTESVYIYFYIDKDDNKLYYSLIDLSLDEGRGGVVEGFKNINLFEFAVCEQLLAIKHGNGRDWWVVVRKGNSESTQFSTLLLTPNGFLDAFNQPAGFRGAVAGELTASLDGSKVAVATTGAVCFPNRPIIALYDFDRCTGLLELVDTLRTRECFVNCYGLAFSQSGSKLYYSTADKIGLYQIDATLPVLRDSLILKLSGPSFFLFSGGQLELNSNGEIIMVYGRAPGTEGIDGLTSHLGVIRYPELVGLACNFDTFGIDLNGRENLTYSLPNFANYDLGPLVGSPCDTLSPQDTTQTGLFNPPKPIENWSVFPTASSGLYTLQSDQAGWLIVHDLYGREVLRQWHEQTTPFDLTAQPAGLYLVHLRAADGTATLPRKIVRQ